MVHTSQLERIRQARDAEGKRPCRIPCVDARLEKEQRLKTATGNYGCLVCGAGRFQLVAVPGVASVRGKGRRDPT
jgi:hypothetical protein